MRPLPSTATSSCRPRSTPRPPWAPGRSSSPSFSPGQQIVYAANKDYWGGAPHVDTLTVIEFADTAARVNALLGGTVDAISQLPSAQAAAVTGGGQKVLDAPTGAWQPFTMRIDQKPFDDVRVRQAFRLIVDRQADDRAGLCRLRRRGQRRVRALRSRHGPGQPAAAAQDLAQAKSLLKAAGYDGNLTVTLTTSDAVGSAAVAAAQVFAEQAKGAGVTVNVNKVDSSVFYGNQYLKWTFAQDFWYTRNYLAQANQGTMPTAPYNEMPLEERQVAGHRSGGLQDGRQDEAQRAHRRGAEDRVRRRRLHRLGLQRPDRRL